ncbi:unknown protein [Waddlia chondrophila 2032/99]|uniref:Uncharacterized protein n=1 Tax=Waddlia chondrophila 2032/99 TaxID=765953 RepID=F8LDD9_9BACT|nr:unknown protein [Waddlia chondrophila 2032/99]
MQLLRIHFRDEQRNIRIIAMIAAVGNHPMPFASQTALYFSCYLGIQSRKNDFRAQRIGNCFNKVIFQMSIWHKVAEFFSCRSLRSDKLCNIKPRMILKQTNKTLADASGCSQNGNRDFTLHEPIRILLFVQFFFFLRDFFDRFARSDRKTEPKRRERCQI